MNFWFLGPNTLVGTILRFQLYVYVTDKYPRYSPRGELVNTRAECRLIEGPLPGSEYGTFTLLSFGGTLIHQWRS